MAISKEVIMKTMLLTLIAILGIAAIASASTPETLTLRRGQQKTSARSEITIKFVSVIDVAQIQLSDEQVAEVERRCAVKNPKTLTATELDARLSRRFRGI